MKKHCNIIGVGLAAAMLAACTAIDEDIDTSLDDGQTAQPLLALSLGGGTVGTRLSDAVVQNAGTVEQFRGISDLRLIPFRKIGGGDSPVATTDSPIGAMIIGETSIAAQGIDEQNHSKYYKNVMVPVGTSAFLVYGKAKDLTASSGVTTEAYNGTLEPVGLDVSMSAIRPADVGFKPVKIYDKAAIPDSAIAVTTWLNQIYAAAGGDWADIAILTGVKDKFTQMTAGSARSVLPFVKDLYDNIKQGAGITAVDNVIDKIDDHINVETGAYLTNSEFGSYPASIGLPDGAAVIAWNESNNQFDVVLNKTNVGAINVTGLSKFAFPPALWYYTNSHIHTATAAINTTNDNDLNNIFDYSTAVLNSWDGTSPAVQTDVTKTVLGQNYTPGATNTFNHPTSGTKLFTANSRVETNTTLVAVTKPLQYGVGRLEMTVKANAASLNDAASPAKAIEVGTTYFPITGILIGSQYTVDYQFHPVTTDNNDPGTTDKNDAVLYDGQFAGNSYMLSSGNPDACNTLSLETKENETVIICVELQNNSTQTFTGINRQVIRPGCRFYLLGKLNPADGTKPEDASNRVFEQDRVTKVNFTVNTLANAYNVIPDFTNPTIKFSLGVTDWKVSTPTGTELQ